MHHETYPTQVFSVFGSYPIGPQGDNLRSNIGRPDSEDCRAVTKSAPKAMVHPAREDQEIHP